MTTQCDVLGLGCVAVDELLFVDAYPPEDTKMAVRYRERHCGGLTATALVAATRMGARCAYAGTLGDDPASQFVVQQLAADGVDLQYLLRQPDARPIQSTIVVARSSGTRTILYDLSGAQGARSDWPPPAAIRESRVLYVDHFGVEGMMRAAHVARQAGVPVVADFECDPGGCFPELLELVNHLVVSASFAGQLTGYTDPAQAAGALWQSGRNAVVVTDGSQGGWYVGGATDQPRHYAAFAVDAVDTTGCGDVFHGAYAAGLAEGLDLPARIRLAAAAAALKVTRAGGQAGIPPRAAVEAFLQEQLP